ncbi:MAG: hypothetical protein ACR2HK_08715 [Gemmatimonadales bacterium]
MMAATGLLGAGPIACEGSRDVAVRVSIPGPDSAETPVSGIGLVALPYDRDSVLAALAASAASPRPSTAELDSLFHDFRAPFTSYSGTISKLDRLRDSTAVLQTRLDSMPRNSPEYRRLYAAFARLTDSLVAAQGQSERARIGLDRARAGFVPRAESLRTELRQWEDTTYAGYDSIVRNLALRRGRDGISDTTGADGWAHLQLRGGPWWIYGRSWDATDPNAEWYWNLPVDGDTVLLSSRSGRRQARY